MLYVVYIKLLHTLYVCAMQELIQNAEDAGATEVKFLFNETDYPTRSLSDPGFAQFQVIF